MRGENAPELGKDVGRRLAILREARDLTQSQLARKAMMSCSAISQYEAGKKIPELATLLRLLEALDYGLAALDRAVHREVLAALTLFRRAAEQEKVTLDLAESLVAFLRRAEHDPALKFREE